MGGDEHPLEQFLVEKRRQRLEEVLEQRTRSLTLVLDRVHNSHNISAVIRSADAFGIQTVHYLGETLDMSSGIALGAERWVDIVKHRSAADLLQNLRAGGYSMAIMAPAGKDAGRALRVPVNELPFDTRLALVFGNERDGVLPEISEAASYCAYIPMLGFVESLNISVAAAITLYCSTLGPRECLTSKEKAEVKNRWLHGEVRQAAKVMERLQSGS